MNKLLFAGGAVGLAMAGLVAAAPAFANGNEYANGANYDHGYGYQQMLDTKAQVLDMDRVQLQTQLRDKTMLQVAEDQGLTQEQLQERMQQAQTERWEEAGLTQAQINERLQDMDGHQGNCDGAPGDHHRYGRQES